MKQQKETKQKALKYSLTYHEHNDNIWWQNGSYDGKKMA